MKVEPYDELGEGVRRVAEVAAGKVEEIPRHWICHYALHPCPNCGRPAGSVCIPKKWRPWGKPCAARQRRAFRIAGAWRSQTKGVAAQVLP